MLRLHKNPHFPLIEPTSLEELELVEVRDRDTPVEGLTSPSMEIRPRNYCSTMFLFPRLELMQNNTSTCPGSSMTAAGMS